MLDQVAARHGLGMPAARPMRVLALYVGGVLVPAALVVWILAGGERIEVRSAGPVPGHPAAFNIGHILVTVALFVIATHLGGALADRLRQPRVIGQAAAGLALGPSLLGQVAPDA